VRDVKSSMVMSKSSGPSDAETERLLKAMNGMKDSIGELLAVLTAHADELRPDDKDFDAFVSSLQSRSRDLAESIAELEHPPVRALPPPSAFMHR
jgi:ABC-type transporter Mla subunit MlaD